MLGLMHLANILSAFCVPGTVVGIGLAAIPWPSPLLSGQETYKYIACYDHCFGGSINKLHKEHKRS